MTRLLLTNSAAKRATILVVLLGALGIGAALALAKDGPPTPTITSHPLSPTSSTSTSFGFTDSQAGGSFRCSLDGSAFAGCVSPAPYSGLSAGSHTFRVQYQYKSGTSDSASFTWTIDRSPPVIAIAFPAGGGSYNLAGWNAGCSGGAGTCGSATDPSGVASVKVSVKQDTTGKYWNGTGWVSSATELFNAAMGATSWRSPLGMPTPDGAYTVHVQATDGLGNATPTGSYAAAALIIDTQAPPAPTITAKPPSLINSEHASFSFTGTSGVTFLCKLDDGQFSPCSSPKSYSNLSDDPHTFQVEARDAAGNVSSAASWTWTVDTKAPAKPKITQHPADPTSSGGATFAFADKESGVGFECKLDGGSWTDCTTPTSYSGLGAGQHRFYVRAIDAAGNRSEQDQFEWKVTTSSGMPFTISGDAPSLLYPGASAVSIPVTLTNPNSVPIFVTSLSTTVGSTGLPSGCNSAWFTVAQSNISTTTTVQVPANGSVTLPAQGATAPTLQMVETGSAQDACKGANLTLGYTGSAHS